VVYGLIKELQTSDLCLYHALEIWSILNGNTCWLVVFFIMKWLSVCYVLVYCRIYIGRFLFRSFSLHYSLFDILIARRRIRHDFFLDDFSNFPCPMISCISFPLCLLLWIALGLFIIIESIHLSLHVHMYLIFQIAFLVYNVIILEHRLLWSKGRIIWIFIWASSG
jgi:hypothetical protein